jgi:uncharacterized protein (TIGR02453 family)
MLQPDTIRFIEQLAKNNNKPWFDAHRDEYATAKVDFEDFVTDLMDKLVPIEPSLREQKAKDAIFRIFRDVRFSKDKTPYKGHFGVYLSRGGRKYPGAGYYLHIEPGGKSFIGGGLWMPEPSLLKAVRQEIDYNLEEFKEVIGDKKFRKLFFKIEGERLKTLPQGYAAENPAIEYLRMKSFTAGHSLKDAELTSKGFAKKAVDVFTTMKPFVDFLNRPMD